MVFTSSIAVFGAPFPDEIGDEFFNTPLTSYGTQKAIGELLLADYTRKGFFDGVGIRLPTICVRPGKPNKAASGFFSNIIREPLAGQEAVLPVSEDVRHWHASPRSAVGFLMHAATLGRREGRPAPQPHHAGPVRARSASRSRRCGASAGEKVVARIRREPDPAIIKIVAGWPRDFDPKRALSLGFKVGDRASTRSSACTSRTNWAARSRRQEFLEGPDPSRDRAPRGTKLLEGPSPLSHQIAHGTAAPETGEAQLQAASRAGVGGVYCFFR